MEPRKVNVLFSSFDGLGLPRNFNLVCLDTIPFNDLLDQIKTSLPPLDALLIVTTNSNRRLEPASIPLSTLLPDGTSNFIQLRLSVPLCGGKGGFGSQLRAAGGRMSSKRKKAQGENNGSNRNLDGRRLRTVNEAKALAEYLALKPDMEKKEKEERRKRWQQVVEIAEKKEEGLRNGSRGKVDGKWLEDKEEAEERTREAVLAAIKSGSYHDNLQDEPLAVSNRAAGFENRKLKTDGECEAIPTPPPSSTKPTAASSRSYIGFDEDDEFMSDSDDDCASHFEEGGPSQP